MTGLLRGLEPDVLLACAREALVPELEAIAGEARALCPVDTGALRASIAVRMGDGASGAVAAGAPYAVCVEMGTARSAARPFLYPAFMAHREELTERVGQAVIGCVQNGGRE